MGERGTKSYIVEWAWDFGTDVHNVNAKTNLKLRSNLTFKIPNQTQFGTKNVIFEFFFI